MPPPLQMIQLIPGVLHTLIVRGKQTILMIHRQPHRKTHRIRKRLNPTTRIQSQYRPTPAIVVRCSPLLRIITAQTYIQITPTVPHQTGCPVMIIITVPPARCQHRKLIRTPVSIRIFQTQHLRLVRDQQITAIRHNPIRRSKTLGKQHGPVRKAIAITVRQHPDLPLQRCQCQTTVRQPRQRRRHNSRRQRQPLTTETWHRLQLLLPG